MAFVQLALPGLQSMVHADGIATILEGVEHIPEGSTVHVQMLP
jgi:molybdopterin biosynthesis enzyme